MSTLALPDFRNLLKLETDMKLETRQKRKHRRDDLEARFEQATLRIDNLLRDCLSTFVVLLRKPSSDNTESRKSHSFKVVSRRKAFCAYVGFEEGLAIL